MYCIARCIYLSWLDSRKFRLLSLRYWPKVHEWHLLLGSPRPKPQEYNGMRSSKLQPQSLGRLFQSITSIFSQQPLHDTNCSTSITRSKKCLESSLESNPYRLRDYAHGGSSDDTYYSLLACLKFKWPRDHVQLIQCNTVFVLIDRFSFWHQLVILSQEAPTKSTKHLHDSQLVFAVCIAR